MSGLDHLEDGGLEAPLAIGVGLQPVLSPTASDETHFGAAKLSYFVDGRPLGSIPMIIDGRPIEETNEPYTPSDREGD